MFPDLYIEPRLSRMRYKKRERDKKKERTSKLL